MFTLKDNKNKNKNKNLINSNNIDQKSKAATINSKDQPPLIPKEEFELILKNKRIK